MKTVEAHHFVSRKYPTNPPKFIGCKKMVATCERFLVRFCNRKCWPVLFVSRAKTLSKKIDMMYKNVQDDKTNEKETNPKNRERKQVFHVRDNPENAQSFGYPFFFQASFAYSTTVALQCYAVLHAMQCRCRVSRAPTASVVVRIHFPIPHTVGAFSAVQSRTKSFSVFLLLFSST